MSYRFADSLQAGSGCSVLILLASCMTYNIAVCTVKKTTDDGRRNCLKHVEFHFKNKFEKLLHLVDFINKNLNPSQHCSENLKFCLSLLLFN